MFVCYSVAICILLYYCLCSYPIISNLVFSREASLDIKLSLVWVKKDPGIGWNCRPLNLFVRWRTGGKSTHNACVERKRKKEKKMLEAILGMFEVQSRLQMCEKADEV